MHFPRLTLAATVDSIVTTLDEAIPYLFWKQTASNDGRMSKAGAMALKFKTLLWAASPTFNSDTKWHSEADEYTCYGNYDAQRWKRAETAGREFFTELAARGQYALTQPATPTHQDRRLAFRSGYYDRGGTEVLVSIRAGYAESTHQWYFDNYHYHGQTLDYVDMFPWADGSDFPSDFDWKNPPRQPFFDGTTPTRDPRLYETAAVPGEIYYNGTVVPTYENASTIKTGGFLSMKFILQTAGDRAGRYVQFPQTRLPEMMLGYAEAIAQANGNPNTEAFRLVDEVRGRVGLPPLNGYMGKDEFIEACLRERALELGYEMVRFFDLVRYNRVNDFTKPLHGLRSVGNDVFHPTAFTFEKTTLAARYWQSVWDAKWYLRPIPQVEVNKGYGMTQNPGW
jgi:hypothetical protein